MDCKAAEVLRRRRVQEVEHSGVADAAERVAAAANVHSAVRHSRSLHIVQVIDPSLASEQPRPGLPEHLATADSAQTIAG